MGKSQSWGGLIGLNIDDLLSLMASRDAAFPEIAEAPVGARFGDLEVESFVEPELGLELAEAKDRVPQVVLVYAPAAVGKTVMARNIARRSNNPYWDLAAFRMGSAFFSGLISRAYGVAEFERFVNELRAGGVTLVLDAADEASVGSASSAYEAAIDDLAGLLKGTQPTHVQAVIFGREETILETAGRLDVHQLNCRIVSVRYFARERAREFVSVVAKKDSGDALLPDFYSFLDEFFGRVMDAFGSQDWADVESFLGYAPVLDSVATFYRTADNAYARLQEFTAPSSRLAVWELLSKLIFDIMIRERDKFAKSFGGASEPKAQFGASAYQPSFQCSLLLSDAPNAMSAEPTLTDETDPEWLADIDSKVHDWFRQHPFTPAFGARGSSNPLAAFANAAFRDFTVALAAEQDDTELHESTSAYLRAHDVNPSVMLSRFIEVRAQGGTLRQLPGELLAAVLESHASAGTTQPNLYLFEHVPDDPDAASEGVVVSFSGQPDAEGIDVPVRIADEVRLGRHLSNIVAHLPSQNLIIGHMVPECQVGPLVMLRCHQLTSRSPEVRVVGSDQDKAVIEAEQLGGMTRIIHGVPSSLTLRTPPLPYPWERFRIAPDPAAGPVEADLLSLGLEMKTIAGWFSLGTGRFDAAKMDVILAKGRASRRMFDFCASEDLIWRDEKEYRFRNPFSSTTVKAVDLADASYRTWLERVWRRTLGA